MKRLLRGVSVSFLIALALVSAWIFSRAFTPNPAEPRVDSSDAAAASRSGDAPALTGTTVTQSITSAKSAGDSLHALRRTFRAEVKTSGSPAPGIMPVELEGFRIYPPPNRSLSLAGSGKERAAYIIQFSRPVRSEWKERIEKLGGLVRGYIPHNALSVQMSPQEAKNIFLKVPQIVSVFSLAAEHKVQPFLSYLVRLPAEEVPEQIQVTVNTYDPASTGRVRDDLAATGAAIIDTGAGRRWGLVRARVPRDQVMTIASWPEVQWVEEYVPPRPVNDRAALGPYMNVTNVWVTRGLSGTGQIIGHADTGLDVGNYTNIHPDFSGRIVAAFDLGRPGRWDDPDGHGTHTAGSIVGDGSASTGMFRGIAWSAGLVHQSVLDGGGGLGGLPADLNDLYLQTYELGARVHANSWGSSVYGFYTTDSRQTDEFMWDHPEMLVVFAAGNDGNDYFFSADGVIDLDSIGSPATAKNLLTVGAAEGGRPPGSGGLSARTYGSLWSWDYSANPINSDYVSQPADLINQGMAAFSSRGPTDDGRIKPEVVAPGTDVVSTRSQAPGAGTVWGAHPNSAYSFGGGTSMSTPLVAGAAALVREYFADYRAHAEPSAALVKAALMHGARSLAPGQYGTNQFQEIPSYHPNEVEGFGQVDVEGSLFPADANWFYTDEKAGLAVPGDFANHVFYAGTGTVKITLNYTDFPATAGAGIKLVNDMDLVLNGLAPRDRVNPFEQIRFDVSSPGIYTARVEAANIPNGPQPYAIIISGPVVDAPRIMHDPLPNQFETNLPYLITAEMESSRPLGSNAVALYWRVSPATNYTRVVMANVTNNLYAGSIPAQVNPSVVSYYLRASNEHFVVTAPAGAPATSHVFMVTRSFDLVVAGSPASIYSVDPAYGTNRIAQGNTVTLKAPAFTNITPGVRVAVVGWTGTGSVPAAGHSNTVSILMTHDSSITWQWVTQYALSQTSSIPGFVSSVSWHNAWSSAATIAAETDLTSGGISYALAGWRVDGARYPNNTAATENPATGIIMYGPRAAEAVYIPADQDGNGNALPDWWEQFYFGTNSVVANMDSDDDGFTNRKEFQDRTNPRDPGSTPQPPSITHLPLTNPQATPAPWMVNATIVDNYAISNAVLFWQRNTSSWVSVDMSAGPSNNFSATIPAPGTNGNAFAYRIEAIDYAGLKAITGPYSFSVAYALIDATPRQFGVIDVLADESTNLMVTVTNGGLASLQWTLSPAQYYDHVEGGTNDWVHDGANDVWNINTSRFASASRAWHFGGGSSGNYPDRAHAWLDMSPVYLHAPARLVFAHWAKMEYDVDQMDDHYWDGGLVEVSVDGGTNYGMIHPEGGYPHRITDNPDSPFAPDTPCYGQTTGWEEEIFDLSAFTGQTVRVRFRFGSDAYVTEEGWYIDNVRIEYSDDAVWSWLNFSSSGSVAPGKASNSLLRMESASLDLGERRDVVLVLEGNDPVRAGPLLITAGIHNASREVWVSGSDNGFISPTGSVRLRYGDNLQVAATANPFYVISGVFTNGSMMSGYELRTNAAIVWSNIQTNGTLRVEFADDMVLGYVPATWLNANGFTNGSFVSEAGTDHDGDGMLTWQEYVASTDPTNAGSVALMMHDAEGVPAGNVFRWLSYTNTGIRYNLEASTNLASGFRVFVTNIPATPPVNSFTNSATNLFEILRVRAIWPD